MERKNRFSVADRFEFLQGLVTEFQDTDNEGMSMLADALTTYDLDSVCAICKLSLRNYNQYMK